MTLRCSTRQHLHFAHDKNLCSFTWGFIPILAERIRIQFLDFNFDWWLVWKFQDLIYRLMFLFLTTDRKAEYIDKIICLLLTDLLLHYIKQRETFFYLSVTVSNSLTWKQGLVNIFHLVNLVKIKCQYWSSQGKMILNMMFNLLYLQVCWRGFQLDKLDIRHFTLQETNRKDGDYWQVSNKLISLECK